MVLGDRFGSGPRGGARPSSSKEPCLGFSGELDVDRLWRDAGCRSELCLLGEVLSGILS